MCHKLPMVNLINLKKDAAQQWKWGVSVKRFIIFVAMMQVIVSTDGVRGRLQAGDCKTETW